MAYSDPNIPTVDIVEEDPITRLISEANCKGVPPTTTNRFALGCQVTDLDGTGIYINTGTVKTPVWTLQGANIEDNAVTEDKIADDAVTSDKIDDGTIVEEDIADNAITSDKIDDGTIVAADLAADSVITAKIKDANVTAAKLAADAVETAKIKDLNVTAGKLAADAVETAKIKDLNVTTGKLAADAVETAKIKDANVTLAKLAAGITPSHIVKFFVLGSTITETTLEGLAVDDLVVTITAAGAVSVAACAVVDTLPADPADDSYLIVFRAVA